MCEKWFSHFCGQWPWPLDLKFVPLVALVQRYAPIKLVFYDFPFRANERNGTDGRTDGRGITRSAVPIEGRTKTSLRAGKYCNAAAMCFLPVVRSHSLVLFARWKRSNFTYCLHVRGARTKHRVVPTTTVSTRYVSLARQIITLWTEMTEMASAGVSNGRRRWGKKHLPRRMTNWDRWLQCYSRRYICKYASLSRDVLKLICLSIHIDPGCRLSKISKNQRRWRREVE